VSWWGQREEIEADAGGGCGEGEAKEGVSEGDGETRLDALVDAGLAGADEATQLLGAVAHRGAGAALANGHKRGEIVGGDEVGQAVGRQGSRLGGEQVPGDEDEERHGAWSFQPDNPTGGRRVGSLMLAFPS